MVTNYATLLFNIYWYFMKIYIYIYNFCNVRIIIPIKYIYNLWSDTDHTLYNILFIKDSKIINKFKNTNVNNIISDNICINYDYIIYKKLFNEKMLFAIYNNNDEFIFELTPCNYDFLLVVIKVDEISYDITSILKNKKNIYYVVNNYLFNESFMNWLSINHIKKSFVEYNIQIIDNNMDEIVLNKSQSIRLQKNDYEIID